MTDCSKRELDAKEKNIIDDIRNSALTTQDIKKFLKGRDSH